MDSFYSGRPGAAFVLKKRFRSVKDMVDSFKLGPSYTEVWYDEYCLIDTYNKNDRDNGKIYQRGPNYSEQVTMDGKRCLGGAGARYVGRIVGPRGAAANLNLTSLSGVKDVAMSDVDDSVGVEESRAYPVQLQDGDDSKPASQLGYKINVNDDNSKRPPEEPYVGSLTQVNSGIVPGSEHDDIQYSWVNVSRVTENSGDDNWDESDYVTNMYVGFQFPYTVVEFNEHGTSISPYDKDGKYDTHASSISEDEKTKVVKNDDGSYSGHPFWYLFNYNIPKGIKGDVLGNLRVVSGTNEELDAMSIYSFDSFTSVEDGATVLKSGSKPISFSSMYLGDKNNDLGDNEDHRRSILVVRLSVYDQLEDGVTYDVYVGDYNQASDIEMTDDGTLTFRFTHSDNTTYKKTIHWVNDIRWDDSTGLISVDMNSPLNAWDGDSKRDFGPISYVKNIVFDPVSGDITLIRNTGDDIVLSGAFKLVTGASISDTGVMKMTYNTGGGFNIKGPDGNDFHYVKVEDVSLGTGIMTDKHINIRYNAGQNDSGDWVPNKTMAIGDSLTTIAKVVVRKWTDWDLLVLYSDPNARPLVNIDNGVERNFTYMGKTYNVSKAPDAANNALYGNSVTIDGEVWERNVLDENGNLIDLSSYGVTSDDYGQVFWRNFGSVKDQSGLLNGVNFDPTQYATGNTVYSRIDFLNGLSNGNDAFLTHGIQNGSVKVVTIGGETDEKEFYGYDYEKGSWYYLGKLAESTAQGGGIINSGSSSETFSNVRNGSLLLIANTYMSPHSDLLKFWESGD